MASIRNNMQSDVEMADHLVLLQICCLNENKDLIRKHILPTFYDDYYSHNDFGLMVIENCRMDLTINCTLSMHGHSHLIFEELTHIDVCKLTVGLLVCLRSDHTVKIFDRHGHKRNEINLTGYEENHCILNGCL